jgi:hypothetical protein
MGKLSYGPTSGDDNTLVRKLTEYYFEKYLIISDSPELQESSKKLFSGPNSPRSPFGMLFDLVNRHDDQAAYSHKLADPQASLPLPYINDDKSTSSGNGEAQNVVSGPSRNSAKTESAKELVFDAENERQRNGFNAKAIEVNENRDKENADPIVIQTEAKRLHSHCDISKATLNMMVEYFKFGTICGKKTSNVRFGIWK